MLCIDTGMGPQSVLQATLVTLWGVRLTWNFWRKGGYVPYSGEDYRWIKLKEILPPLVFQVFCFFFIVIGHNLLLFAITWPLLLAALFDKGFDDNTWIVVRMFLIFFVGQVIADEQQWRFQKEKYQRRARKETLTGDFKAGFLRSGLFRASRHPNFFCEICIWWTMYLFSCKATGILINWTVIGALMLNLLFLGSTWFTERISSAKYPEYAHYQQTTSKLIPFFPRRLK